MNRRRKLVLAVLATAAASVFAAPAASGAPAGWDYELKTEQRKPGASVLFKKKGDVVKLCDLADDGWAARLDLSNFPDIGDVYKLEVEGKGRCVTHRASEGGKYDLPENREFEALIRLSRPHDAKYGNLQYWNNNQ